MPNEQSDQHSVASMIGGYTVWLKQYPDDDWKRYLVTFIFKRLQVDQEANGLRGRHPYPPEGFTGTVSHA